MIMTACYILTAKYLLHPPKFYLANISDFTFKRLYLSDKNKNMKKILLAVLITFSFGSFSFAQDFSFDELVKLRSNNYPAFESYVHDKGYSISHVEYNERCTVFRNANNVISYCRYYDDGFSYHKHISVKYETSNKDEYEKLKKQVESGMTYYTTRLRRFTRMHYMEHIYTNDALVVRLYDISYRDDDKPYYEIEISSIYSGVDRYHWCGSDFRD